MDHNDTRIRRIDVTTVDNVPLRVIYIPRGCDSPNRPVTADRDALVEFYDRDYPFATPDGQFISDYYAGDINCTIGREGLDLSGGVPEWSVDIAAMNVVRAWLALNIVGDFCASV